MARTANHEARTKGELVTVSLEAGRQRETPNPRWLRYPYADRQAVTNSEVRCSIVSLTRSNAVSERAETLTCCRRQYPSTDNAVWLSERSGVAGTACREGCSVEDGRSDECVAAAILASVCVSVPINATRERARKAPSEVRGESSSNELPAMGRDAKDPRFSHASNGTGGSPMSPEGVAHG